MRLSLIVALDRNGLIGRGNTLPWRLPADLKHFKDITMGKPVIMGRKTYESIGRPLPGRRNIVLSRDAGLQHIGVELFRSTEAVMDALADVDEAVVIGGAEIYRLFRDRVTRAYISVIDAEFVGDTWFPGWPFGPEWNEIARSRRVRDAANPFDVSFLVLEKLENDRA